MRWKEGSVLTIRSTGDVSLSALENTFSDWASTGKVTIDDNQYFFKSMDVPSWVHVLLSADAWKQLVVAGLSVYAAGFLSEAGKESWKKRGLVISAAKSAGLTLQDFAKKLVTLQNLLGPNTSIAVGLPIKDDAFALILNLNSMGESKIETELALIAVHATELAELIESPDFIPLGSPTLEASPDETLSVKWMDRASLEIRTKAFAAEEN
jgi:hypothetical protein